MDILIHEDIEVPKTVQKKWQEILDLLAKMAGIPVALIMKARPPYIEVFTTSKSEGNPYKKGDSEKLPGLYCETVLKTDKQLLVPDARKDEKWSSNPDIKLGMVSYLGQPVKWPDGKFFGTICILDSKENAYSEEINKLLASFRELVEFHLDLIYRGHLQDVKIEDYERFQKLLVDRELKMAKLKTKIKELEQGK